MKNSSAIMQQLADFKPEVISKSATGSTYIRLTGAACHTLRISNHNGRGIKRGVWQLRTDANSCTKDRHRRIYSIKAIPALINALMEVRKR